MASQVLSKWGNSLGLRVPKDIAERVGMSDGTRVNVEARDDGSVVIRKAQKRYTLEELVAGMTPEKEHPSWDDEPVGHEFPNEEP
jgi:antitoxin MazE